LFVHLANPWNSLRKTLKAAENLPDWEGGIFLFPVVLPLQLVWQQPTRSFNIETILGRPEQVEVALQGPSARNYPPSPW
jgi:hypothetical protein